MKIDFKISELLTLPITIMAALSLASGIVLFSPNMIIEKLYMVKFRDNFGFIIGIVFVISISILIINLLYQTSKTISEIRAKKKFYATAEDRLKKLNDYQKAIVYLLFNQHNRTHELPLHDGAVLELEKNFIVGKATTQYFVSDLNNAMFPYLLQPWVADELKNKNNLRLEFERAFQEQY